MARFVQAGVHGRARRRIVAMGGLFAERFNSPSRYSLISQDRFLALLLRNGVLTEQQLHRAIDSYSRCPQDYAWMLRLRHTTLDKADRVFFVRHRRFPTESSDFYVRGDYCQICQTLQYDPDRFDAELRQSASAATANPRFAGAPPRVLVTVQQKTSKKGNTLVFAAVLLLTLASAIGLAVLMARAPIPNLLLPAAALAVFWMTLLACGLFVTRPRKSIRNTIHYSCSECRGECGPDNSVSRCPRCGVRFQEQRG